MSEVKQHKWKRVEFDVDPFDEEDSGPGFVIQCEDCGRLVDEGTTDSKYPCAPWCHVCGEPFSGGIHPACQL